MQPLSLLPPPPIAFSVPPPPCPPRWSSSLTSRASSPPSPATAPPPRVFPPPPLPWRNPSGTARPLHPPGSPHGAICPPTLLQVGPLRPPNPETVHCYIHSNGILLFQKIFTEDVRGTHLHRQFTAVQLWTEKKYATTNINRKKVAVSMGE